MARRSRSYGTPSGLIRLAPPPIASQRNPGDGDVGYSIGQTWINSTNNTVWTLTGYSSGLPNWQNMAGTILPDIERIEGNAGGPVGCNPATFVLNLLGSGPMLVTGNPATFTQTVTVATASETVLGAVELATAAETTTGTSVALAVHPAGLNTKLGTQTANGLIYGRGGAGFVLGSLAEATNGQLPIGSTGLPPVLATLTAGVGTTIVNGAGSITISSTGSSAGSAQTIGAVTANIITIPLGAVPATVSIDAVISGFEGGTPASAGYKVFAVARTDGIAGMIVGVPNQILMEDAALAAADATVVIVGNDAIIQSTGVALLTIEWDATAKVTIGN